MKITGFQEYYVSRLAEINCQNTLDTYRVRSNNTITLLGELDNLCEGWFHQRIKQFETVQNTINELLTALENDTFLDYGCYPKNALQNILNDYNKEGKNERKIGKKVSYLIREIMRQNEDVYLHNLTSEIERYLFDDNEHDDTLFLSKLGAMDALLLNWSAEIIRKGHSKSYLYFQIKDLEKDIAKGKGFEDAYHSFLNPILDFGLKEYRIVIPLNVNNDRNVDSWPVYFKDAIPDDFTADAIVTAKSIRSYKDKHNVIFFDYKVQAHDIPDAIAMAYRKMYSILDAIQITAWELSTTPLRCFVAYKNGESTTVAERASRGLGLDGKILKDSMDSNELRDKYIRIIESDCIEQESRDRLISACRYLRMGNNAQDLSQAFTNYWIALEFLYSSPANDENTIGRLKLNLVNVLTVCYIKRNFLYVESGVAKRDEFTKLGKRLWELTSGEILDLISNTKDCLLKNKLWKLYSRFWQDTKKGNVYLTTHRTVLTSQLIRIYRVRNELIHEAAIKANIEGICSNLRYYLLFSLVQMINYFIEEMDRKGKMTIDDFFYQYQLISTKISCNPVLRTFIDVPLSKISVI